MTTLSKLYESANKAMAEVLANLKAVQPGNVLSEELVNPLLGNMLNRVGRSIVLKRNAGLKYPLLQAPVDEYGAFTEYIGTKLVKPIDQVEFTQGGVVDEFVTNLADFKVAYSSERVKATYLVTTTDQRWKDAIEFGNTGRLAELSAIAVQSMYDSVNNDMNNIVPVAFGKYFAEQKVLKPNSIIELPQYDGTNIRDFAVAVDSVIRTAIRKLGYISSDYNLMDADINTDKEDLILVAFDISVDGSESTILDIITSELNLGAISRSSALQQSLGIREVYEMQAAGLGTGTVAQSYATSGLTGQQIADMKANVMSGNENVAFALISKGALNVGAKSIRSRIAMSARADATYHYVHTDLEVAFGTGNAVFFVPNTTP